MEDAGSESQVKNFFKNKWVRLVLVIDVLVIVFIIGVAIWNATKTATLIINVAPVDAKVQVGSDVYSNGTYKVHPGTYDISVSKDGLDTKTFTVDVGANDAIDFAVFLKAGEKDFNYYTMMNNYESFRKLAEIASAVSNNTFDNDTSAEAFVTDFQKKYNLYESGVLPIEYTTYDVIDGTRVLTADVTIRRGTEDICEKTLCLEALMALTNDNNLINNLLTDNGLNPADYEIHYKYY